jgi:hypothetical protein
LNIGRLLFYTIAGFCAALPVAMCLLLLGQSHVTATYWVQFVSDLVRSSRHFEVWIAGLIFGFIIAVLADATVDCPKEQDKTYSYAYQYPRLYSGGVRAKDGASKDYAAWLISEYYRYYEIAVFIPYGLLLSLPVYAIYSLFYSVGTAWNAVGFVVLWAAAFVVAWKAFWNLWVPQVAKKVHAGWVEARHNAIDGLKEFVGSEPAEDPEKPAASKAHHAK